MSTKKWKNNELKGLLTEQWGFSMDLSKLNEAAKPDFPDIDGDGDREEPIKKAAADKKKKGGKEEKEKVEENESVFAPNHYCVHHGGVERNGSIEMAEAVSHNYSKRLGKVTHYDMKFSDGFIMENVAFEDIQVTNASLAQEHKHVAKRDDEEEDVQVDEAHCGKRDDEELDEVAASSGRQSPHADRRGDDERKRPMQEQVLRKRIRKLLKNVKFK